MFLTTASPLAAAIGCVASRPSLYRVLLCRPVTPLGLGCQRNRIAFSSASKTAEALDREKADSLVLRFTEEERIILLAALQSYQAKKDKAEYEGGLELGHLLGLPVRHFH